MLERLRGLLLGGRKNLLDPGIHRQLALIAFFAWVGLGSDGLSSSSYGPEQAFLALGRHTHLALYLTAATVLTIFIVSASYSQIIELFPSGGGGYLVATKLLGVTPGVISGAALVVDYALTIAISAAAAVDAIFSFLPPAPVPLRLGAQLAAVAGLTALNLRGTKESVRVLVPVFAAFVLSHLALIGWGLLSPLATYPALLADTTRDTHAAVQELGLLGVAGIFLRAFSLGGATFTGIEAVSNSTASLREPRVETGKRTMFYLACSLSLAAGGILVCYLLNGVQPEAGRTLNATLWTAVTRGWTAGGVHLGPAVVVFTLLSESALLLVAAQTGFVAGPATLAAMAVDQWVPKRLAHLSERLVTQNGILTMGIAAAATLLYARGAIRILVVMYAINVFLTFTLSQLGMVRHWWQDRRARRHWRRRLTLAAVGTLLTAGILVLTAMLRFREGGWVTLAVTAALIAACALVRRHYQHVRGVLRSLDEVLTDLPVAPRGAPPDLAPDGPTAIVLVESYAGLGIHTLLNVLRMFPHHFRNVVFVSVGLVDSGQFKGTESVAALEEQVRRDLEQYVELAQRLGLYAEYRYTLGTDLIEELEQICLDLMKEFRRILVFAGQLVFQRETLLTRSLHHETAFSIQRRLQFAGTQVIILPIRVWEQRRTA
ncbi:MAG TPA: APC family permease [Candidatus Eisenbacteria bacterium]|nr:APC family permease [Candidatus Eisenbacteria bacterium]